MTKLAGCYLNFAQIDRSLEITSPGQRLPRLRLLLLPAGRPATPAQQKKRRRVTAKLIVKTKHKKIMSNKKTLQSEEKSEKF